MRVNPVEGSASTEENFESREGIRNLEQCRVGLCIFI